MKECMGNHHDAVSRRRFLQTIGLATAGLVAAACSPAGSASNSGSGTAKATVAIAKADSYDRKLIKTQLQAMLDGIGGLKDVMAHGNRVAIKVNLTGGTATAGKPDPA